MITLTGSTKPKNDADTAGQPNSSSGRTSAAEMNRLREIILGETTERVEDISRQVTNRDARVRRLIEDMPDAIKHSSDKGTLDRLADALRAPIEEALHQSVRGDGQKLADILAPALARALPRTLGAFFVGLPVALARRVYHVVCPWTGRSPTSGHALPGLGMNGADNAFQVDGICLFQKNTLDVLRTSDAGFDDEETSLEVDHLFAQLADALRSGSLNPTAGLRYPRPKAKNEPQGILVLQGDHTILAAYYQGQPASWLRVRLQDLADEADGEAQAALAESAAGQSVEHRLQALDALLKKGLVCHVPQPKPATSTSCYSHGKSWLKDAAVVTAVIGVVWLVASVARASTKWNEVVSRLDAEAGIVVTDHSWLPGQSITGLRDPLAADPASLLAAKGYKPGGVKLHFSSFLSDEAPFKQQRDSLKQAEKDSVRREISNSYARTLALMEASLEVNSAPAAQTGATASAQPANETRDVIRKEILRTLLELPADTSFEFKNGTITIPDSLPKATRSRIREVIKAVPWVKEFNEATLPAAPTSSLPTSGIPGLDAIALIGGAK